MTIWRDNQGLLHDDMNGTALFLPEWPQGMVELTESEAKEAQMQPWSPSSILLRLDEAVQSALQTLLWVGLEAQVNGDTSVVQAAIYARQSLIALRTLPSVLSATSDESLRNSLVTAYGEIVSSAPQGLKDSFSELNI